MISACYDQPQATKKSAPVEGSGKISLPAVQNKPPKDSNPKEDKKSELNLKNDQTPKGEPKVKTGVESVHQVAEQEADSQKPDIQKKAHYASQGKIDPFSPLIQDKSEESRPVVDEGPKRILTPLEKIELSQIRLVAVIIMKNKRIAMVEEANGKGYEVGIGTYIGKNQGKVSEIKSSSIVIKELVKDYKGRLKEQVQEIKL
ncbi:MAG: pilus assembly protein PilP, partial [Desulfobacula sp.]|nr:pilus assembly protein PilP [Desulfobacula sp.]